MLSAIQNKTKVLYKSVYMRFHYVSCWQVSAYCCLRILFCRLKKSDYVCRFLPVLLYFFELYFWTVAGLRFVISAVSWMLCVLRRYCICSIVASRILLPGVPRLLCFRIMLNSRIDVIWKCRWRTIAGKCLVTDVVETPACCAICFNGKSRQAKWCVSGALNQSDNFSLGVFCASKLLSVSISLF